MTMTHSHHRHYRRRLDVASLALLLVGIVFGTIAYWLIVDRDLNPLALAPAVIAVTLGASHLVKHEADRG